MSDRVFFSLAGVAAVLIIAFALVWPQGLGAPSPGPFRRPLGPVDPEVAAAKAAAAHKAERPRLVRPGAANAPPALRAAAPSVPLPGGRP